MSELDNPVGTNRTYIVLRKWVDKTDLPTTGPVLWEAVDWNVSATSAEHAIRTVAPAQTKSDGQYVAVPLRSWKPVIVKAEQTTVLKLEEAK